MWMFLGLLATLAPVQADEGFQIEQGRSVVVETPSQITVSRTRGKVVEVRSMPGAQRVHLIALVPGQTEVELRLDNGADWSFPILVVAQSEKVGARTKRMSHLNLLSHGHVVLEFPRAVTYAWVADGSVATLEPLLGNRYVLRGVTPGITDLTVELENGAAPMLYDVKVQPWETWPDALPVGKGEWVTLEPPFVPEHMVLGDLGTAKLKWDGTTWKVRGLAAGPTNVTAVASGKESWVQEIIVVER